MSKQAIQIEGTWEEISARGHEFRGQRVRLILLDAFQDRESQQSARHRPMPDSEQARLGILPAAIGSGSFDDIMASVRSHPITTSDTNDLWDAIAHDRAERRAIATLADEHHLEAEP